MRTGLAGQHAQRHFTLVELLAAMAVLVLMMFLLFRFIAGAQQAWSVANSSQEVFEKARIAMDLITRDLQSALARSNDVQGYHIRFQQVDESTLRFVGDAVIGSEGSSSRASLSPLCEIGYELQSNEFNRVALHSCEEAGCTWDLYRDRSGGTSYFGHAGGFQQVIDGVLGLRFVCYNESMVAVEPWLGTGVDTALPARVDVQLRVMDSKSFSRWQLLPAADKSKFESEVALDFTKTVFLGDRE